MKRASRERKSVLMMTMTALFWAGAFIAGKVGVREFPPLSLTFFRFLLATVVVFPVMIKFEKKEWRLNKSDWLVIIVLGLVGILGYYVLFFTALKFTLASDSSMIVATSPLITSLLATMIVGEKFSVRKLVSIGLALFGVMLAVTDGQFEVIKNMSFNIGHIIMFGAVFCQAIYSVLSKKVMDRYSPLIITAYSFLVGLIALTPFVIMDNPLTYLHNVTMKGWGAVIYMAIFASVIAFLFQQTSIKIIGASKTMAFVNLVPVFTIALSAMILKEKVTYIKLISVAIIIVGVYLNSVTIKSQHAYKKNVELAYKKTS